MSLASKIDSLIVKVNEHTTELDSISVTNGELTKEFFAGEEVSIQLTQEVVAPIVRASVFTLGAVVGEDYEWSAPVVDVILFKALVDGEFKVRII